MGLLLFIAVMSRWEVSRVYLIGVFSVGLIGLLLSRWGWRKWLHRQRQSGEYMHRSVVIGEEAKAAHLIYQLRRDVNAGYETVGVVTDQSWLDEELDVPASVGLTSDEILAMVDRAAADTLIVTSSDSVKPADLRRLGWALQDRGVELVVAPALTDIAGPRIHTRPVGGLPLLHIDYPELTGWRYWEKRVFDVIVSGLLIVVASPLLLAIAIGVKFSSPGPVLFSHTRIGQDGTPFRMLKFRSMVSDADSQLKALLEAQGTAGKPLFKVTDDPRITPFGRFIRKYSLDELPQLFNAFLGSMSLVGPRPQVAEEVALYDDAAYRRLMVKPGLTGLWQVSGRSDLSWEDAIRLDLYYVENWSLVGDLVILAKTVRAVLKPDGAY